MEVPPLTLCSPKPALATAVATATVLLPVITAYGPESLFSSLG